MSDFRRPPPSPEQEEAIHSWGKGMAILAGAGSGKTTTVVAKCIRLVTSDPKARFAAVSFTERSATDLRAKLSVALAQLGIPGALNHHWVMTIHGLCGSIIREFPRDAGFDGEETILSESEVQLYWERAIEVLWLDDLPINVGESLERLLDRESRQGISHLLQRSRELFSFGILDFLKTSEDPSTLALQTVASFILDRYERIKRRRGVLDFNDLERGADRALENERVREIYHRRFDLVLVDEFQDTNPLQAKIIRKLCREDASNLCVVGDPKQSIYRFRDADVSVFEEFCSQLPAQLSLTWNFRSVPGIIAFTNQVCEKIFQVSDMRFEPLIAKRNQESDQRPVVRLDMSHPSDLGKWIQGEVEKGIPLHDMALLVRKIRGNERWFKALTATGIPIAIGSGGLFWEEPRVREMVSFLKWWDNPGNSFSGAVFLRAPWMKISDLELDRWVKQDPSWQAPFFNSGHPLAEILKNQRNQILRPGELLMMLLINQEVEDELGAPLLGLWHRVEELTAQGLDFHGVVAELVLSIEENRREREVPAPRNLGCLLVLTLHGAKGLEFPHVILIDLGERRRTPDMPLLFWDRNQGAFLCTRDENGERDQKNSVEKIWRESEKKKNLEESKRLFYVALTRARDRLILVCPELKESKETDSDEEIDPEKVYLEDHWRGWLHVPENVFGPEIQILPAQKTFLEHSSLIENRETSPFRAGGDPGGQRGGTPQPLPVPKWTRPRHSVTEWTLLSRCPRAYEWTFIRPLPPNRVEDRLEDMTANMAEDMTEDMTESRTEDKFPVFMHSGISQQELGSRVHACLEHGDYLELERLESEVGSARFSAKPVINWAQNSEWMAPSSTQLGRTVWSELDFEIPFQGQVLVGSIDRLVKQKRGDSFQYSVIDFKVTGRPKSVDAFLEAYQTQIELYALAVRQLDPQAQRSQLEAVLVNISSDAVQIVPITVGKVSLEDLARSAIEIVDGKLGPPKPGPLCKTCEFRPHCPEGSEYLRKGHDPYAFRT